jgi:hypothetical protein
MSTHKRKFLSLLDRMEKKYTLNESIEKKYILTEGIGGNISKYVKKIILNVDDIQLKLSKYTGDKPFKMNDDTESFAKSLNIGIEKLANQVSELSNGEIVKNFIKSSTINKAFDLFIDRFVDGDLKRLGILQDSSESEILKLKRFLKGLDTLPQSLFQYDEIVKDVLYPLKQQHLVTKQFTMLGNTMAELINSKDITDIILGLMKRDGDYYSDLSSTINNIVDINEYVNMKFPKGTKTVDGVDIGGQRMFPKFQITWNTLMTEIGEIHGIVNLEKNLTPDSIKRIMVHEIKNKGGVGLFKVKHRNKVSEFIKRKKMKNIPKTVTQKFGGKITEADLQDSIIIKTKDGMDVFVPKNENSKTQLSKFLEKNGIKHEGFMDWFSIGRKNTDGGKDLAQINRRMKYTFWSITAIPVVVYAGSMAVFYTLCMMNQGEDIGHTDEEIEFLKGKKVVQDEWSDQVLNCGSKSLIFWKNFTEVIAKKLWNGTIKGKFLLLERSIGIAIEKRCEEYKTTNDVDCCNINCDNTAEGPMMITIGGEEKDVSEVLKNLLSGEAIKDWANEKGLSIEEVIQKFDEENILDGAFTEDGNSIDVKGIIKKICYNTVNSEDNVKCISTHLQKTWDEFMDFKGLKVDNCNYDGVKEHINNKIDELKKYEDFIKFSEEKVPGKFIIKQENLNGLLQEAITGKKIKDLDTLRNGYIKIVNTIVKECSTEGGGGVKSKNVGDMTYGEMNVIYETLLDMVMALYDQGVWGVDCDVYGEMTEEQMKDNMYYFYLEHGNNGTIRDSSSLWGQVDIAYKWWYPKYSQKCGGK